MRPAYEHETALWRERIKQVTTATLKELGFVCGLSTRTIGELLQGIGDSNSEGDEIPARVEPDSLDTSVC